MQLGCSGAHPSRTMNRLQELERLGQSVWLDGLSRDLVANGQLRELIEQYGASGVISNWRSIEADLRAGAYDRSMPAIFEGSREIDAAELIERLSLEDIAHASRLLEPVYERSQGGDGFISIDVNPHLAYDTRGSVHEAERLWTRLARPNLMVKVPATLDGIAAIEQLTAAGVPVNATLIFTVSQYENVAEAYLRGLERSRAGRQANLVASFPVCELDSAVDRALEEVGTDEALSLQGKAALAVAELAYLRFRQVFHPSRFPGLEARAARPARPLWMVAAENREDRSQLRYAERLIAQDTICALALDAFPALGATGRVQATLGTSASQAEDTLGCLLKLGISLKSVGQELTEEGVEKLEKSYDELLRALAEKRASRPAA